MSNPKAFYNQPDYRDDVSSGSRGTGHPSIGQKPNQLSSSELLPPPPYSPDPSSRRSNDENSGYGTVRNSMDPDEEQHVGLLRQQPEVNRDNDSKPYWKNANPHVDYQEPHNSNTSSSSQQQQPTQGITLPSTPSFNRRNARNDNQDPGCCGKWCKYIFLALLVSLVFYKYSDSLGFSGNPNNSNDGEICSVKATIWEGIPRSIEFKTNVEVVTVGQISFGEVTIIPTDNRFGGSIVSDIRVYPESLQESISHEVQLINDITRLSIKMPQNIDYDKECITVSMEIRLPYGADILRLDVSSLSVKVLHPFVDDVKIVDIKTSNGVIDVSCWTGNSVKLITTNGDMKVGSLRSGGSIFLQTSNGLMSLSGNVVAKRAVTLRNSNGEIESFGLLQSEEDAVDAVSNNGQIQLSNVKADHVSLQATNDGINVKQIDAKVQVLAKTSNGPVSLAIGGAKNNQVNIVTSNSEVDLHMTNEFEGDFLMSTSIGEVYIVNDEYIKYQDDQDYLKRGYRKGPGNKGDLTIQNSNGDIRVAFDA